MPILVDHRDGIYAGKMPKTAIDIGQVRPADLNTSVAVMARAFWDDPMFNFFTPDLLTQHKHASGFFASGIHDSVRHGEVWVAKIDGTIAGVAAWLPPGIRPATGGPRALRGLRHVLPSMVHTTNRVTAYKFFSEMATRHPKEEHWYLGILGTDPRFQGRGVGTALITPMLERADEAGVPTYLETQKESNVPYYRRFGFEVTDNFSVNDSPTMWQMLRKVP